MPDQNDSPKKMTMSHTKKDAEISQAVEQAVKRAEQDAANREALLTKQFEGERNVFTTRIESLQKTIQEQSEQIAKLSQQLEKAYLQVEGIALKAVESSSDARSGAALRRLVTEQSKKSSEES